MAKRKKSKISTNGMASPPDSPPRISLSIEGADNGSIVHISGDSGGRDSKYTSKNLIASNPNLALRIATSQLRSMIGSGKGGKKKKSSGKSKIALKRA